jgi:uncharacterized membrane protein YesL
MVEISQNLYLPFQFEGAIVAPGQFHFECSKFRALLPVKMFLRILVRPESTVCLVITAIALAYIAMSHRGAARH